MKVMLFGATGMAGQGVLREFLLDPDVQSVLSIGRSATGQQHQKFSELVHKDFLDFSAIENELTGFDAFTAGAREELLLKSAARNRTKEVRQLACEIRHVAPQHRRAPLVELVLDRFHDRGVIVSGVVNAVAGEKIEDDVTVIAEQFGTGTALVADIHPRQVQASVPTAG